MNNDENSAYLKSISVKLFLKKKLVLKFTFKYSKKLKNSGLGIQLKTLK